VRKSSDVREYIGAIASGTDTALSGIVLTPQQASERFVLYRILYMNRSLYNFRHILETRFADHCHANLGETYDKVIDNMQRLRFIRHENSRIVLTDRCWRILNKVKIGMPSIL
jgi:hypothetical protein